MAKKSNTRPLRWLRRLKNTIASVCIPDGRGGWGGYRTVRVIRARWNKQTKQVIFLRVRLFGGDPDKNKGFNGHIVLLDQRQTFTGKPALGINTPTGLCQIDEYVTQIYKKQNKTRAADKEISSDGASDMECRRCGSRVSALGLCQDKTCPFNDHRQDCPKGWAGHPDVPSLGKCTCGTPNGFDEDAEPVRPRVIVDYFETIPPLKCCVRNLLAPDVLTKLADILAARPELLQYGRNATDLPKQAFWKVQCPAGDTLEFSGYRHTDEKGPATGIMLTGYITAVDANNKRKRFDGTAAPKAEIRAAVDALLKANRKGRKSPKAAAISPPPPRIDEPVIDEPVIDFDEDFPADISPESAIE